MNLPVLRNKMLNWRLSCFFQVRLFYFCGRALIGFVLNKRYFQLILSLNFVFVFCLLSLLPIPLFSLTIFFSFFYLMLSTSLSTLVDSQKCQILKDNFRVHQELQMCLMLLICFQVLKEFGRMTTGDQIGIYNQSNYDYVKLNYDLIINNKVWKMIYS